MLHHMKLQPEHFRKVITGDKTIELRLNDTKRQRIRDSINRQGLLPMARLYIHLSTDQKTAWQVGQRHGRPVIYQIQAGQMHRDGYRFYRSKKRVWLTKTVPEAYIRLIERR